MIEQQAITKLGKEKSKKKGEAGNEVVSESEATEPVLPAAMKP